MACLAPLLFSYSSDAQEIRVQISTREAWVGSPVVLQIQIANANDYSLPESLEVDGCDVRSAGTPSQSSQITIFNGRRSESRSVTAQYLVTPKREGRFQIPAIEVEVDGKTKKTQPISFVATKSETGDLLLVEVVGKEESVFVGEPLDLKLKIWIKPFADREKRIKLDEGNMWQMIARQTSWGAFEDRLRKLAENRQRPGGKTVLRTDSDGREREYYLYELDATVYPTKPGEINASDLQIVVNYPMALGRSRDPFASFFGDSPRGARSIINEMMEDNFFSSPFGRSLTVSKSRPIVAEAKVNSTSVLPVPGENQPADYRGAVGRYKIVTEADPKNVASGDPITLKIGVIGDGPMELVQAPPLHEFGTLTADFQVTDQSLGGFVQNDTKVFVTTIRPRNENVTQIPAIPFTFFDPEKEAYETVYSNPIDIAVEKAESLGLDAIVSAANASPESESRDAASREAGLVANSLDFSNEFSNSVLRTQTPPSRNWWWYFAIVPPIAWLVVVASKMAMPVLAGAGSLRSPSTVAIAKVKSANDPSQLIEALRRFVESKSKSACPTIRHAVGEIRNLGAYQEANTLESLFNKLDQLDRASAVEDTNVSLANLKDESTLVIGQLDKTIDVGRRKKRIRRTDKASRKSSSRRNLEATVIGFILLGLTTNCPAANQDGRHLEVGQLETTLQEANKSYQAGVKLLESEPARAKKSFATAANRYQTLVDQGVRNSDLFCNLGNAFHRSGDTTNGIVNYHRALWINPRHARASQNLEAIKQQQRELNSEPETNEQSFELDWSNVNSIGTPLSKAVGHGWFQLIFAISSVTFWLLITVKTVRRRSPVLRWSIIPMLLALAIGWHLYSQHSGGSDAIIIADNIELKHGDGHEFKTVHAIESTAGLPAKVFTKRDTWAKVRLPDGAEGWLPLKDVALVRLDR